MANSKIPDLSLTDTLNTSRLKFNQLLDSVGDVSTLTTTGTNVTAAINEHDAELGTITSGAMGTTASTVSGAIAELDGRLDSINNTELLSPRTTLSDSSATNVIKGNLQVDTNLHVNGNTTVSGNLTVDGIATLKAGSNNNIDLGDGTNADDTVTFKAEVASNILPDVDDAYDIGSSSKEWRHGHFDGTVNADNIAADSATLGTAKISDLTSGRVVLAGTAGEIQDNANLTFDGSSLSVTGNVNATGTVVSEGALTVEDSAYITGNLDIGGNLSADALTLTGDVAVNGGDLTTTATTFNLVNANATTLNIGSAATTVSIGSHNTGTTTVQHDLVVDSNLTVHGIANMDSINVVGDVAITGSINVSEDFTVTGNFVTLGEQRNVSSFALQNDGVAVIDANRAGLAVDRPSADSAVVQWNEAGDYWEVGTVSSDTSGADDVKQIARQHDSATFTNLYQTGTGATRIPAGTTANRPTPKQGQIRYNTDLSAFEGYSGANWGSLGGLVDVDQDTYVVAERTAGSDSDTLQFYAGGTLKATIANRGLTVGRMILDSGGIDTVDGGKIQLYADSGADGAPEIQLVSLNGAFDAGTIKLLAADDINIETVTDIVLETDALYVGQNSKSGDRGFIFAASSNGGTIRTHTSDSSSYNTRPQIQFFDPSNAQSFADGSNTITYTADSHRFYLGGIHVRDEKGSGSRFDQDVLVEGTLTIDNPLKSNATSLVLHDNYTGTPPNLGAGGTHYSSEIQIERGTKDNAKLKWNETGDYWEASDDGDATLTESRIITTGFLNVTDALSYNSTTATLGHADTSSVSSSNNSGRTYIQDVLIDSYGHVTGFATATETVTDTNTTSLAVQNSSGTTQFTDDNVRFASSGAASVSFDAGTNKVTIGSTDTNYSAGTGLNLTGTTFSLDSSELRDMVDSINFSTLTAQSVRTGNTSDLILGSERGTAIYIGETGYGGGAPETLFSSGGDNSYFSLQNWYNEGRADDYGTLAITVPDGNQFATFAGDCWIAFSSPDGPSGKDLHITNRSGDIWLQTNDERIYFANSATTTSTGDAAYIDVNSVANTIFQSSGNMSIKAGTAEDLYLQASEGDGGKVYLVAGDLSSPSSTNKGEFIFDAGGAASAIGNQQSVEFRVRDTNFQDNDFLVAHKWTARNSAGDYHHMMSIEGKVLDVSNTTEDAHMKIYTQYAGDSALSTIFKEGGQVISTGLYVGDEAGSIVDNEIRATGDITAFHSSDIALKENIEEINDALDKINSIRGVFFDWTDDHIKKRGGEDGYFVHKRDVGVIAQEVEKVLPEVVRERDDGTKAVEYHKIVALLIEGMKEQQEQINDLKWEINNLKGE